MVGNVISNKWRNEEVAVVVTILNSNLSLYIILS